MSGHLNHTLEVVLQNILDMEGGSENTKNLITWLRANDSQIAQHADSLDVVIDKLSPASNAAALCILLNIQMSRMTFRDPQYTFAYIGNFCKTCDPTQIRRVNREFVDLVLQYSKVALENNQAMTALPALRAAVERFRPYEWVLTPLHSEFLKVCLKAKHYTYALPVLDKPILDVMPKYTLTSVFGFLLYFYYGGLIYIGVKRFHSALQCFHICLGCPGQAVSAIQMDAWKKFVLVTMIETGEVPAPPKNISQALSRVLQHRSMAASIGTAYYELTECFRQRDMSKLRTLLSAPEAADAFNRDQNLGLAKQCLPALQRRLVLQLTSTYLTLSLEDLRTKAYIGSIAETESLLFDMITRGQLCAQIDHESNHVVFTDDGDQHEEASAAGPSGGADESVRTAADLDRQITQMLTIARQLKKYENDLSLNENYLRRQMGSASEFSAAGGLGLDEDGLRGGGSGGLDYGELIDDV